MPTGSDGDPLALLNPIGQDATIFLDKVSVRYRVPAESVSGAKEYAIRWVQRRIRHHEVWALKEASLEVRRGELFGVIGRNGAGKSSMLRVVARVLRPTDGRVVVVGSIAPLLELGGGFHPELTGRENVYLYAAILGQSRAAVSEHFGQIEAFAEIGDFIDLPIRTYSSGMVARLGFSVATSARPDVLLVDEILSVGDEAFRRKCIDRMEAYRAAGTTILYVTHSLDQVEKLCERAVWLDHGRVMAVDRAAETIRAYRQFLAP